MIFVVRGWPPQHRALPGVPESLLTGIGKRHSLRSPLVADACDRAAQPHLRAVRELALRAAARHRARPASPRCGRIRPAVRELRRGRRAWRRSTSRARSASTRCSGWCSRRRCCWSSPRRSSPPPSHRARDGRRVRRGRVVGRCTREPGRGYAERRAGVGARPRRRDGLPHGAGEPRARQRRCGAWSRRGRARASRCSRRPARSCCCSPVHRRVRVRLGGDRDIMLSGAQLPALGLADEPEPDDGPVLIQIEYRIEPGTATRSCARCARSARCAGATARTAGGSSATWPRRASSSSATSSSSWAEYVRLRSRMTIADRHVQQESRDSTSATACPIRVSRFLGVDLPERARAPHVRKYVRAGRAAAAACRGLAGLAGADFHAGMREVTHALLALARSRVSSGTLPAISA